MPMGRESGFSDAGSFAAEASTSQSGTLRSTGAGRKLVSEEAAARFEAEWRAEVHGASADALTREHNLARVVYWSRQGLSDEDNEPPDIPADPRVTLASLKRADRDQEPERGQSCGSPECGLRVGHPLSTST